MLLTFSIIKITYFNCQLLRLIYFSVNKSYCKHTLNYYNIITIVKIVISNS